MFSKLSPLLEKRPHKQWRIEDFSGIDQLHLGGIHATLALLDWLPHGAKSGLDIGCGLGGTSRLLSNERGCNMVGLDLNHQYIRAAMLLNQSIKPEPQCQFVTGNSLHLPFPEHSFNFVISQHSTMNIKQKEALLKSLYSVLKPRGHLLIHEIMLQPHAGENDILYPTPWADEKGESHLCHWQLFNGLALAIGFKVDHFKDDTDAALTWIRQTRQQKAPPPFTPSLALGANAAMMSVNVLRNIEVGYLQVISARLCKL